MFPGSFLGVFPNEFCSHGPGGLCLLLGGDAPRAWPNGIGVWGCRKAQSWGLLMLKTSFHFAASDFSCFECQCFRVFPKKQMFPRAVISSLLELYSLPQASDLTGFPRWGNLNLSEALTKYQSLALASGLQFHTEIRSPVLVQSPVSWGLLV